MPGSMTTGTTPALNKRKHEREKVEAGPDHEHGPRAPFDPGGAQAQRDLIAVAVKLAVGQMRVANAAAAVSPRRSDDGLRVRLFAQPSRPGARRCSTAR